MWTAILIVFVMVALFREAPPARPPWRLRVARRTTVYDRKGRELNVVVTEERKPGWGSGLLAFFILGVLITLMV
jgi:hypothetical protein